MVSELLRLTGEERIELMEHLVAISAGRGATFASVGAESTRSGSRLCQGSRGRRLRRHHGSATRHFAAS